MNMISILSLPLPELSRKLRDGSLPLEHVFYAYVGKVRSKGGGAASHPQWGWLFWGRNPAQGSSAAELSLLTG